MLPVLNFSNTELLLVSIDTCIYKSETIVHTMFVYLLCAKMSFQLLELKLPFCISEDNEVAYFSWNLTLWWPMSFLISLCLHETFPSHVIWEQKKKCMVTVSFFAIMISSHGNWCQYFILKICLDIFVISMLLISLVGTSDDWQISDVYRWL